MRFLLIFLMLTSTLLNNAQSRHIEFEASSQISPSSEFTRIGSDGISSIGKGDIDLFRNRIGIDFRIRPKIWLGMSFERSSFNSSNILVSNQFIRINLDGTIRSFESRIWYRPKAEKNKGLGAYFALRYSPINLIMNEKFTSEDRLITGSSSIDGRIVEPRIGVDGYWYLKPITNLGVRAEAYLSPVIVGESYRSLNLSSMQAISSNGLNVHYSIGASYRFLRFYGGLDFGQDFFLLQSKIDKNDLLSFKFSSIRARVGLFLLKRK